MSDAKQNAIPYTKERCLKAAIVELVADHETLKREVNELREHNSYLETRVSEESDYATLLARHNALVEAVKWERECECFDPFFHSSFTAPSWPSRHAESHRTKQAARAEVGRLIAAADCKGEG